MRTVRVSLSVCDLQTGLGLCVCVFIDRSVNTYALTQRWTILCRFQVHSLLTDNALKPIQ